MNITAVNIRNFRSLVSMTEKVRDLNIFVGQNDEGKSNILRALDLFFNHDKDDGYKLEWNRDYCCFAPQRVRKAEEIIIEIEVTPPSSFKNRNPVLWRKIWRREGLYYDLYKHRNGSEVTPKSKIAAFLKTMRFEYVPAIKGKDYFKTLMAKLYDMLQATVEEQIRAASGSFTATINDNTRPILEEILDRLKLDTAIQLPSNLRDLFAQLEFTSVSGEKPFSLEQRGDGIKVRHIPIVLRWLSEQANHLSAPGRPKTVTIWGYEEPENNLELRRCFDLAQEFVAGCDEIQAFVTTHSPAFYSVFRESDQERVALFLVTKDTGEPITSVRPLADVDLLSLDTSMGLMSLLEPHFKQAQEDLAKLRKTVDSLTNTSRPTIFCEGRSDKIIFEECLKLFFPTQAIQVSVLCSNQHGGGHNWVGDQLIAWSFSRPLAKAIGLFDKDADAQKTMKESAQKLSNPGTGKKAFAIALKPGIELKTCFSHHVSIPYAVEEILPADVWDFAESKGWLEDRSNLITLYKFDRRDITFDEYFTEKLPDTHLQRLALKKVKLDKKTTLAQHVCMLQAEAERRRVLDGFKATLEECLKTVDIL